MKFGDFLYMGAYTAFVWTAYGLTALVLVLNWVAARRSEAEQRRLALGRLAAGRDRGL